jgi:hypothetical protein
MSQSCIDKKEKDTLKSVFDALDSEKDGEVGMIEFVDQMKDKFDIPITL